MAITRKRHGLEFKGKVALRLFERKARRQIWISGGIILPLASTNRRHQQWAF
jgi:hypothetical protein